MTVEGIDDEGEFEEVLDAMNSLGFAMDQKDAVLSVVAAVLHLGNLQFEPEGGATDGAVIVETGEGGATFLGVPHAGLQHALVTRQMSIARETVTVPLRPEQANENRDALGKFVYDRLFDWLVLRINQSLAPENDGGDATTTFIGILDIFGFEIFELNSFEQLCINFTNEKLQQIFNEDTFKNEQAVYEREGVKFPDIEFSDVRLTATTLQPSALRCSHSRCSHFPPKK